MEKCTFDYFKRARDRAKVLSKSEMDDNLVKLLEVVVSDLDDLLIYAPLHIGHSLPGYDF